MQIQLIHYCLVEENGEIVLRLTGRDVDGRSVLVHVHGYAPSFYVHIVPRHGEVSYALYEDFVSQLYEKDHVIPLGPDEVIHAFGSIGGFENGLQRNMCKLTFNSLEAYHSTLSLLRSDTRKQSWLQSRLSDILDAHLYDCEIDPLVKSLNVIGLKSCGWIEVTVYKAVAPKEKISRCDVEIISNLRGVKVLEKAIFNPHFRLMTFDFETYSSVRGAFPNAEREQDEIFQASVLIRKITAPTTETKKYLLHLYDLEHSAQEDDNQTKGSETVYIKCDDEAILLTTFSRLIRKEDPDIFTGHNIDGFDWNYFFTRLKVRNAKFSCYDFSRVKNKRCDVFDNEFRSAQVSSIARKRLYCQGRLNLDFQVWVERNTAANKYENYRLETIAQKELKEGKDGVSPEYMFEAYRKRDPAMLAAVAKYCIQDSLLVDRLVLKLNVIIQVIAMAQTVNVPPAYLMEKGQTVKANSMLTAKGYKHNKLIPYRPKSTEDYGGGGCLPVKPGIWGPVACDDFNSLYPSIMIAYSICPSTLVEDERYLDMNGVEYNTISWKQAIFVQYRKRDDFIIRKCKSYEMALHHYALSSTPYQAVLQKLYDFLRALDIEERIDLTTTLCKDILQYLKGLGGSANFRPETVEKFQGFSVKIRKLYKGASEQLQDMLQIDSKTIENMTVYDLDEDEDADFTETMYTPIKVKFGHPPKSDFYWKMVEEEEKYTYACNQTCIIGEIEKELLQERKAVRRLQAQLKGKTDAESQLLYQVYEGQQLAYKVTANSIYGALALRDPRLGASITGQGRNMLRKVCQTAETQLSDWLQSHYWTEEDVKSETFPIAVAGEPYSAHAVQIQTIGGDTDSVFLHFPGASINQVISWNIKACELFSSLFKPGIVMEFEKVWDPYICIAKKKGVGRKYTDNDKDWTFEPKGVETKRRNYCQILKEMLLEVFMTMLNDTEKGAAKVYELVQKQMENLLLGSTPMEKLLISTRLKETYKQENLPGLDLAKRMQLRNDYDAPQVGTRFQYLFVKRDTEKQYRKSESLDFAQKHNLQPDYLYYIQKQFKTPILGFMTACGAGKSISDLFLKMEARAQAIGKNQTFLAFNKDNNTAIAENEHKRKRQITCISSTELKQSKLRFTRKI